MTRPQFALLALLVLVLSMSANMAGSQRAANEVPLLTLVLSEEEVWGEALEFANWALQQPKCIAAFRQHTGIAPAEFEQIGVIRVAFPDPWPIPDWAASTTCAPIQMSFNLPGIHALGSVYGGAVIIHEVAHAALCAMLSADELMRAKKRNQLEEIAEDLEEACVWEIEPTSKADPSVSPTTGHREIPTLDGS